MVPHQTAQPARPPEVLADATENSDVTEDVIDDQGHDETVPPTPKTQSAPVHENAPASDLTETEQQPNQDSAESKAELAELRTRLDNAEALLQRHERMLRWTQLMLKHHERMLRRRLQKAMSNA